MANPHIVLQGATRSWDSDTRLSIGRMAGCDVVLDDASVSRRHAEVYYSEAGWSVRDLGSTNGTFLNGARLGCIAQRLQTGDRLQPGKVVLCVQTLEDDATELGSDVLDRTVTATPARTNDAMWGSIAASLNSQPLFEHQRTCFLQTIQALAQAVDRRDPHTAGHAQRVTDYVLLLAEAVKVSPEHYRYLQMGTPLHDIGKIGIAESILTKPGRLTRAEHVEVQSHTVKGAAILEPIPDFGPALAIVRNHHEHWDGRGYPDGLIGEAISPLARMVTVADVFDALTSDRSFRRALTVAEACAYIEKNNGTLFDPTYGQAFLQLRPRLEQLVRERLGVPETLSKRELDRLKETVDRSEIPHLIRPR